MSRSPVGRVKLTMKDGSKFSVLTVWRGDMGGYSISPDRHTEQYPAMSLFDALKAWSSGHAFLDYWPADNGATSRRAPPGRQRQSAQRNTRRAPPEDDFDPDDCGF